VAAVAENLNEMKQGLVRLDAISFGAYWMPFHLELIGCHFIWSLLGHRCFLQNKF
jgi:hypothetical protein